VKDLIAQIEKETFEFKEPWRATNKSLTIVVPIVSKTYGSREYYVLEEVKDKITITDTGKIDEAKIRSNVDKPTFIRGGTMLKGATQERSTHFGTVIAPNKTEQVIVHCIHASRGIRAGAGFVPSGHTPRKVYSMMLAKRSQSYTWNAVSQYSASALTEVPTAEGTFFADDLVGAVEAVDKFREDLKEILKSIPSYVNQFGTLIADPDGILGVEMYDHPDSWKAFSESIMRSFSDALTKEGKFEVFKPNMEAIIPLIQSLLKEIREAEEEEVFNKDGARTVIIRVEGYVGEYTTLNSKTIHLLITRCEKEHEAPSKSSAGGHSSIWPRTREPTPSLRFSAPTTFYTANVQEATSQLTRRWKTRYQLLKTLDEPKSWTALTAEVPMAKATLASSLKELQQIGAVDKHKDENGVTRYSLSGIGYQMLKKKED
jgi:DNA-binding HxlR family transcriptional regulator/predicted ester cyclase